MRLPPVRSFVCYYGSDQVDRLAEYDLAIIESENYSAQDVARMKRKGAKVVGYVSVGETRKGPPAEPHHRASPHDAALPPYYLDRSGSGAPDRNGEWGSLYVDARTQAWHEHVLQRLVPAVLHDKQCDGLLLDTVDTVDVYPETTYGMVRLIERIREWYPHAIIVCNRGFTVLDRIGRHVDAFLFENFSLVCSGSESQAKPFSGPDLEWIDGVLARLRAAAPHAQVLALDYAPGAGSRTAEFAKHRALRAGLPYCLTVKMLDRMPWETGAPGGAAPAVHPQQQQQQKQQQQRQEAGAKPSKRQRLKSFFASLRL